MKRFDPFVDRLCRDIRNDLSEALMNSLSRLDLTPVQKVANCYLETNLEPLYRQYIDDRMQKYGRALDRIRRQKIDDAFRRALVLWDEELFFEVHEILENAWMNAAGKRKLILQAMIRAAGMYIQLDHGNATGAASMATKAVATFEFNRNEVPDFLDLDLLLSKLRGVDPVPPKLTSGSKPVS